MKLYNIADITFSVCGPKDLHIENRMEGYSGDSRSLDKFSVEYVENNDIALPNGIEISQKINNWKWFIDGDVIHMVDVNKRFDFILSSMTWNPNTKRAVIQVHDTCPFTGIELSVIFFNLIGMLFGYVLPSYNGIAFHSSAMSYKNSGILISAPSGTGKSTHTSLWKKCFGDDVKIINDDRPVIRKTEDGFFVYGAPWSGKTTLNENIKVPLKAIVCIRRGETNSIRRLDIKEAFVNLFNETYTIPIEYYMSKTMDILREILENVPIYELKCTVSEDAVNLLKSTLNL